MPVAMEFSRVNEIVTDRRKQPVDYITKDVDGIFQPKNKKSHKCDFATP